MHSFLDIAMLHWVGFLNSQTSSDIMGYLQAPMELAMWVNSRNEHADDFVKIAGHTAEMSVTSVKGPFTSSESRSESGEDQRTRMHFSRMETTHLLTVWAT